MNKTIISYLLVTLLPGSIALAQCNPTHSLSTYVTAADGPVSVYSLPDGQGNPLSACHGFGGEPDTDATILLTVMALDPDGGDPIPVENFPAEDIWLETFASDLAPCYGGQVNGIHPDSNTDQNGQTIFNGVLNCGGQTTPGNDLLIVLIGGCPPLQDGLEIHVNSPDINGDWVVDLTDVTLFAIDYLQATGEYRSDFWWDGVIDISDLVLFARGMGAQCP